MNLRMFFFFLFAALCLEAKAPELTPAIFKGKVEAILRSHVTHKELSQELVARTLSNFLDEMDPIKTYLIESDISEWTHPSEELLNETLEAFARKDYSIFQEMHLAMIQGIERRRDLEAKINSLPLISGVTSEEFKDLGWTEKVEALEERLHRIRSLQAESAEELGETKDLFLQRLEKRKTLREAELLEPDLNERNRMILGMGLKAITASLDAHTNYFTPSEAASFAFQVQQRMFGIGAQLRDDLNGFTVVRIIENSPADLAGTLKLNDRIVAVNGELVVGMDINEAVEHIRGEKGTGVTLTVIRGEERHEIELTRNEIVLDESRLETKIEPFGDGVIAHLKLYSFYQDAKASSASDMRKAIQDIQKEHNLLGVVLDLRSNAGGLLPQAVSVSGLFLKKGVVCSIKNSQGAVQHLREMEGRPAWDGPLLVLVNRASASAAEIVAQSLQDYGRAIVVGDRETFGKGTFQTFTLDAVHDAKVNPQGEYKVTRGCYYTVSGKSPQLIGVLSDIVVPGILSELEIGEKHSRFPLANDQIDPHFEDDLSDLPAMQRMKVSSFYKYNRQEKLEIDPSLMERLKANSHLRIDSNLNYQEFLGEIGKKKFDSEAIELFSHTDLQLHEAISILKDLIYLNKQEALAS